jgi:hypothetical protein
MTPSGGRRVAGWTAFAAGTSASILAAVLAVHSARPPADVGALPAARPSRAPALSPAPADAATQRVAATAGDASERVAATAGDASERVATTAGGATPRVGGAVPARVSIGSLHVNAPVDPVGVRADRSLAVPDDPRRIGWWIGSATPRSARGTVLLAGHVDTADQGVGALFRLERLTMGSTIGVSAAGQVTTYRAVARRSFGKQHLPPDLFDPSTAPRLVLVTCGGTFRHGTYSHNVVVYAEPD